MRRPDASVKIALATIAWGLASDWPLLKRGLRPHTRMLRDNWKVALAANCVLWLHVADVLGPFDPFIIAGRLTGIKSPEQVVTEVTKEAVDSMTRMA